MCMVVAVGFQQGVSFGESPNHMDLRAYPLPRAMQ